MLTLQLWCAAAFGICGYVELSPEVLLVMVEELAASAAWLVRRVPALAWRSFSYLGLAVVVEH